MGTSPHAKETRPIVRHNIKKITISRIGAAYQKRSGWHLYAVSAKSRPHSTLFTAATCETACKIILREGLHCRNRASYNSNCNTVAVNMRPKARYTIYTYSDRSQMRESRVVFISCLTRVTMRYGLWYNMSLGLCRHVLCATQHYGTKL